MFPESLTHSSEFKTTKMYTALWCSQGYFYSLRSDHKANKMQKQWVISFRSDWFDLAVQGTLKSLFQYHSLKASILLHSAAFMVQLSHLYMTTRKTIALSILTFVCKVTPLLFSTLSRLFFQGASIFLFRDCSHHLQ